jgi:Trk K+ transport system NAD-binding subunit
MDTVSTAPPVAQPAVHDGIFIVCGLGSLGRQCVDLLKPFGVVVIGVDKDATALDNESLAEPLDRFIVGDCVQADALRKAGVESCRSILLVTTDERANIAAAFTARSLNPRVRLIIRSAQDNLNALLKEQLGNLVAFEPSQFSAGAFALASLGDAAEALFEIGDVRARVARDRIDENDGRLGRAISDLDSSRRRFLAHARAGEEPGELFFPPNAGAIVQPGDIVTYIETEPFSVDFGSERAVAGASRRGAVKAARASLSDAWERLRAGSHLPKTALVSFGVIIALTVLGVFLFRGENPDISWFDAINVSVVLAVGGFDNVFGALKAPFPITPSLYIYSVIMKVASTVFLGVVFATLTETVLSARLQIARRRRAAPVEGHTIIVGMGAIGQKIGETLRKWRVPLVGVSETPVAASVLPDVAMQVGPVIQALERANVATAQSVVVVLDDQVANLEVSLLVHKLNPACKVVFRTEDQQLARHVATLVPSSTGISDYFIAAEAITGAAFGENILSAFHLDHRSALVTEYTVDPRDTLASRQLAEIACGYGVAPILLQRGETVKFAPSDDVHLHPGDRLFVLATVDGLRRVEHGDKRKPDWALHLESLGSADAAFDAATAIARVSGCSLVEARAALTHLPAVLATRLYQPQGARLVRELRRLFVHARLEKVDADHAETGFAAKAR